MTQMLTVEEGMIGGSPQMLELFRSVRKVAPTDSTVLICGESGTGKQLVARAIHSLSERGERQMISVNCAAIPADLIESELFGHEKGAFPGATETRTGLVETADGSTLFLDEIGELPLEAQARLLRVLQENEIRKVGSVRSTDVDVRLVAATHRDLKQLVADGDFREDLYYRINVMTLLIPPLRERGDDILGLAEALLENTCSRLNTAPRRFSPAARRTIAGYSWPGNVREMENAIERAVVLAESEEIDTELLAIDINTPPPRSHNIPAGLGIQERQIQQTQQIQQPPQPAHHYDHQPPNQPNQPVQQETAQETESLQDYFQRFVLENEDTMNETQLAKALGISRKSLWERRQRFGLPRKKKQGVS